MEKSQFPCWASVAIITALALVGVAIWRCLENPSELPAWVQAIGSVGAIFVAIHVMNAQNKRQVEQQKDEMRAAVFMLLRAIEGVQKLAVGFHQSKKNDSKANRDGANYAVLFRAWSEMLRRVDFTKGYLAHIGQEIMDVYVRVDDLEGLWLESQADELSSRVIDKEMYFNLYFVKEARASILDFAMGHNLIGDKLAFARQKDY